MKIKIKSIVYFSIFTILTLTVFSFKSDEGAIKKIDYYADAKQANKILDIVKNELAHKRKPVLYFYATWCGPCKQFKNSLTDPLMIDALNGVTLIMIDGDIDLTKEKLSTKYKVTAFPNYVIINSEGKLLKQIDGGAWDENIPKNMAPVLKAFLK